MCDVVYYNAYVDLAYLSYVYRYLCYQGYSNRTTLERVLKEHQSNGTKIGLYYNPHNPRDAKFNLLPISRDVATMCVISVLYLLALAGTIAGARYAYNEFVTKHRNNYDSIPEAPEPQVTVPEVEFEQVSLVVNSGQPATYDN